MRSESGTQVHVKELTCYGRYCSERGSIGNNSAHGVGPLHLIMVLKDARIESNWT